MQQLKNKAGEGTKTHTARAMLEGCGEQRWVPKLGLTVSWDLVGKVRIRLGGIAIDAGSLLASWGRGVYTERHSSCLRERLFLKWAYILAGPMKNPIPTATSVIPFASKGGDTGNPAKHLSTKHNLYVLPDPNNRYRL